MRFFGRTIKYLLRSLFSIIVFLLLVGLAKMHRDTTAYISFLNTTDRSVFHRSQPATWTDPFWSQQSSGAIADMFSGDTEDMEIDDMFSDDTLDTELSGTTEADFGFTSDEQSLSGEEISSGSSTLSQLIKQRELTQ